MEMEKCELQVDEIRLLHLSRSAPSLLAPHGTVRKGTAERVCFCLFDYFDWLTVHKGDKLDYKACFGLEQAESDASLVSSEYLTLVLLAGEKEATCSGSGWKEGDPFFLAEDQDPSQLPFLSVMMVTALPDPSASPRTKERGLLIHPEDVERFLRACADELRRVVREVCDIFCPQPEGLQVVFQVYHCLNSGNFCIVARSRVPELTYHISMCVRAETLYKVEDGCFPRLDCSTYSLVGLFCPVDRQPPETLLKNVTAQTGTEVALRLSVTNEVRNNLFRCASDCVSEDLRGLYGRYDVTLHLNLDQFGQLYPWICAHKLDVPYPEESDSQADTIVRLLRKDLCNQGAQYINARLLLCMEGTEARDNNGARRKARQDEVKRENERIKKLLLKVKQLGDGLVYCQDEYRTCLCLLEDLWESYDSLRYQDDSFIAGNILLVQVNLLLNIVTHYLESIQQDCNRKSDYETLSKCLRFAINSIDHYQKLMLSINQQSMQAPNYEVQMHSDMEKYVVAYTEFSRRFLAEHILPEPPGSERSLEKHRQLIFPIITVNTTLDAIQAHPLFLLPYCSVQEGVLCSNEQQEELLLSIEVPETGFLGDVYVILPLICHELFHNFRVLNRSARNDVLAKFLFHRIAQFVVRRWFRETGEKNIYHAFGRLEDELYVDELAALLNEGYRDWCGKAHNTANIGVLTNNIRLFLTEEIFTQREKNQLQRPELTLEQVEEQMAWLCRLALDASEDEKPAWSGEYQTCRELLKSAREGDSDVWKHLSEHLAQLARAMSQTVADGHQRQIGQFGEILDQQIPDTQAEAKARLKAIRKGLGPQLTITRSESEVDGWIETVCTEWKSFQALCDSLKLSEESARTVQMLDYAICDMCRCVKDANHLYLLLGSWDQYQNRPHGGKVRDKLIQQYHWNIRRKVDRYYQDKDLFWLLHSSPSIHALTAPLGSDMEEEAMFAQTLKRILLSTSQSDIFELTESSTTLYREVFADLGMCASLNLSSFGYLNVLAHSSAFQVLNSQPASIKLERIWIVCLALFAREERDNEAAVNQLCEDCRSFFRQLADCLERDMTPEGRNSRGWNMIVTWVEDLFIKDKQVYSVPAFRLPMEEFRDWFSSELPDDALYSRYNQLKALWILVHLANHLNKTVKSGMRHPLQPHFSKLFPVITQRWQKDKEKAPESEVLSRVGAAYSNPAGIDLFLNPQVRFKDTLSFVLYYYYHGWNVYGWSDRSDADAWLNALMGGTPL